VKVACIYLYHYDMMGAPGDNNHERQNGGTLAGQETVRNHHRLIDGHGGTSDGI
jgi:hypothetical protein